MTHELPPKVVELTDREADEACSLSSEALREFGNRAGVYGRPNLARHIIGKLGEIAVSKWFKMAGARSAELFRFEQTRFDADLIVNRVPPTSVWDALHPQRRKVPLIDEAERRLRNNPAEILWPNLAVEVKTWSARPFDTYGRCISAVQLGRILQKSDVVIWCRVLSGAISPRGIDTIEGPARVELNSWNRISDLSERGVPTWRAHRAELRIGPEDSRPLSALGDERRSDRQRPSDPQPSIGECGHSNIEGLCWGCAWPPDAPMQEVSVSSKGHLFHTGETGSLLQAHGTYPFSTSVWPYPIWEAALRYPACPYCFGDVLEPS